MKTELCPLSVTSLVDLLQMQVAKQPEKLLYTFLRSGEIEQYSLTFFEFEQRVKAVAVKLQQHTQAGDRVLLMFSPDLDYITAFFACLYSGTIAVPSYPIGNRRRDGGKLSALIKDCASRIILTKKRDEESIIEVIKETDLGAMTAPKLILVDDITDSEIHTWKKPVFNVESLAFLQYTSGSTGSPKGVMVSHSNLLANLKVIQNKSALRPEESIVSWLPPYHDMGLIGGLLTPIYVGMHAFLMEPVAFLQKPYRWLKAISDHGASLTAAPNFAYQLCIDRITDEQLKTLNLSHWRIALSGAEPVRKQTIEDFNNKFAVTGFKPQAFYPAYGMAEATLLVTAGECDALTLSVSVEASALQAGKLITTENNEQSISFVSCGTQGTDHEVGVVNPQTQQRCNNLEIGEVWVRGPSVAQGYWKKDKLTEQTFQAYLNTGEGPWLRTGDLGFLQKEQLYISGRSKDLIVLNGRNFYPQDIESLITDCHEHILTDGCAAFSIEHPRVAGNGIEEKLVIVQELSRQGIKRCDLNELASLIRRRIATELNLVIVDIMFIRPMTLPRTSSGKIQHYASKEKYLDGSHAIVGQVPLLIGGKTRLEKNKTADVFDKDRHAKTDKHSTEITDSAIIHSWLVSYLVNRYGLTTQQLSHKTAFVDLGMDSAAAVTLIAELSEYLDMHIDPVSLWNYPTIGELCNHLSGEEIEADQKYPNVNTQDEDIAVIGMACRLPAGNGQADIESTQEFWQWLNDGGDAVGMVPENRKREISLSDEKIQGGFLADVDKFDPSFFEISPRDAACLDPQQRLLYEVTIRLLENASLTLEACHNRQIGIFIGSSTDDYAHLADKSENRTTNAVGVGLGTARSAAAGRLAYFLGTQGPALHVDTACSSSAYSIHLACQSILSGESEQAIAGGVNLILNPESYMPLEAMQALSPTSRCRTFSDDADGYIRSEGCSLVMLKRLSDAQRDGDTIHGVIRASSANQDGRSHGLTAPNGQAQRKLLKQTIRRAGVSADQISYIETHGTGTALGDPIEVNALADVIAKDRKSPLLLGALKSNLGHLESAAGSAALIKTLLCLKHQRIPANLHFTSPNAHINWSGLAVKPVNESCKWPTLLNPESMNADTNAPSVLPALAGVSAFGMSGTNVHFVVGAAPVQTTSKVDITTEVDERSLPLVFISAKTSGALTGQAKQWAQWLKSGGNVEHLIRVCSTRSQFVLRAALRFSSKDELINQLCALAAVNRQDVLALDYVEHTGSAKPFNPILLFTGQGALYHNMASDLFNNVALFKEHVLYCEAQLSHLHKQFSDIDIEKNRELLSYKLTDVLFGEHTSNQDGVALSEPLQQPLWAQVSLYVVQTGIVKLLKSAGIKPSAVIGHSVGEYAVAYASDVFTLEDGLSLLLKRGLLTQSCVQGTMLAVTSSLVDVEALIGDQATWAFDIAAVNSARQVVFSGDQQVIHSLKESLDKADIRNQVLLTTHPFHSRMMSDMAESFYSFAELITYKKPTMPWFSTVLGRQVIEDDINGNYWRDHIVKPVQFEQALHTIFDEVTNDENTLFFIDIGPKPQLSALVKSIAKQHCTSLKVRTFPTLRENNNTQNIAETYTQNSIRIADILAQAWCHGSDINVAAIQIQTETKIGNKIPVPGYCFDRQSYWLTPSNSQRSLVSANLLKDLPDALTKLIKQETFTAEQQALLHAVIPKLISTLQKSDSGDGLQYQVQWQPITVGETNQSAPLVIFHTGELPSVLSNAAMACIKLINQSVIEQQLMSLEALLSANSPINVLVYFTDVIEFNEQVNDQSVLLQPAQHVVSILQTLLVKLPNTCRVFMSVPNLHADVLAGKTDQEVHLQTGLTYAPLWGAIRSLVHEYNDKLGCIIDLPLGITASDSRDHSALLKIVNTHTVDSECRIRDGEVQVPRLLSLPQDNEQPWQLRNGAFVITGGLGALGLALANYLVVEGATTLIITSRRGEQAITSDIAVQIAKWQEQGCHVLCKALDVANKEQVKVFFSELPNDIEQDESRTELLTGIFHLAGIAADSQLFDEITPQQLDKVWSPKVSGALWLHEYSQALKPKYFVLFSSIASLWGYTGQTAYSSANYFLDWLAQHRRQCGLPAQSINWGPWQGDGMAASELVNKAMAQVGIKPLNTQAALVAMAGNTANKAIVNVDWSRLRTYFTSRVVDGLLSQIKQSTPIDDSQTVLDAPSEQQNQPKLMAQLNDLPLDEQKQQLKVWLINVFSQHLETQTDRIHPSSSLTSLGLDSISALDIKHEIQKSTSIDIPITLFLKDGSIELLGEYLIDNLLINTQSNALSVQLNADLAMDEQGIPLSYAQQSLWVVNQWQKQKGLYNIHATIRVTGQLDPQLFARAMEHVVARHESLRTRFVISDTGPIQFIEPEMALPIQMLTWPMSDLKDDSVCEFSRNEAHQVFDLENGPLFNVVVLSPALADIAINTACTRYITFTLHHIIADAWSMDVLIKEFSLAYHQLLKSAETQLTYIDELQYRHYAVWQREYLKQGRMEELERYWLTTLDNMSVTEFKSDFERPERQDLTGRCQRFELDRETTLKLKALAEQQDVTLFVLLLSVFKLFIHLKTGKTDVVIGTDVANREQSATRDLIGFFVNLLVLRSNLDGNPDFISLLKRVNGTVHNGLVHQDMPFHHLVEQLNPPRDTGRNPLVQVLFVLQNAQSSSLKLDGLTIETVDIDEQVCRFDQSLFMHEKDGTIKGDWHYATSLYSENTMQLMASEFQLLLTQIIAQPTRLMEEYTMTDATELALTNKRRKEKKKAGFGKFKSKSVQRIAPVALVEKQPLSSDKSMPLVIRATSKEVDACGWAQLEREQILKDLSLHGAILFRDFSLETGPDFEAFAQSICPTLFGNYGDLPKEKEGKKIYHSTPYPNDKPILFHNESSHLYKWPTRQLFFCAIPSPVGGHTPIVDCREVYRQMDPEIREMFETKHLRYVRNFSRNLDVSWQYFFKTEIRQEVEEKCINSGVNFKWLEDDGLRTWEIRRAVTLHPDSGEKSFFNQIQLHHSAFLPDEVRESLIAIKGEEGLPRHVYFGDGSPISDEIARYTLDLYEQLAVRFDWQKGDVVLLDNMMVAHARDPFEGKRKINVAMAELITQEGEIV